MYEWRSKHINTKRTNTHTPPPPTHTTKATIWKNNHNESHQQNRNSKQELPCPPQQPPPGGSAKRHKSRMLINNKRPVPYHLNYIGSLSRDNNKQIFSFIKHHSRTWSSLSCHMRCHWHRVMSHVNLSWPMLAYRTITNKG
jgi:hypothetical protein